MMVPVSEAVSDRPSQACCTSQRGSVEHCATSRIRKSIAGQENERVIVPLSFRPGCRTTRWG